MVSAVLKAVVPGGIEEQESWMQSVRVPLFQATRNGLHFTNSWPSEPDYTLSVLGQNITLGDASNGLCGGMVYTVNDLFQTLLLPPSDTVNPADGTPLFNYIVARLTNSFDEADVNQYLSWIQMSDHDTGIAHGLAWHEITEEWPKIQGDLDAGVPSPLGLVHGQEPPTVGFFTGMQDLGNCHQVLAWGYDLDGTSLTIHIYDPDNIGDGNTIALDIGSPGHTTPIAVSNNPSGFFRGFFRTHYEYHDPRTPASGAFIGTVVTSPGITSAGPIPEPPELLRNELGEIWVIYGGAGFHVPDMPTLERLFAGVAITPTITTVFPTAPDDGTLLREESGAIWVVFGSAKFQVPDMPTLNRLFPGRTVNQLWDGATHQIPDIPGRPDLGRVFLREESGAIWVVIGGAKFHVPDMPTLNRLFGDHPYPLYQLWDGAPNQIPYIPVNGTLLREESSPQVYIIEGGHKLPAPAGAVGQRHELWDGALAQIPDSVDLSWLSLLL